MSPDLQDPLQDDPKETDNSTSSDKETANNVTLAVRRVKARYHSFVIFQSFTVYKKVCLMSNM